MAIAVFWYEYLCQSREVNLAIVMHINTVRGFPGYVEYIDCQDWEELPSCVSGPAQGKGKEKSPKDVLEAVGKGKLWICNAFLTAREA